jgi:hypothetical protein
LRTRTLLLLFYFLLHVLFFLIIIAVATSVFPVAVTICIFLAFLERSIIEVPTTAYITSSVGVSTVSTPLTIASAISIKALAIQIAYPVTVIPSTTLVFARVIVGVLAAKSTVGVGRAAKTVRINATLVLALARVVVVAVAAPIAAPTNSALSIVRVPRIPITIVLGTRCLEAFALALSTITSKIFFLVAVSDFGSQDLLFGEESSERLFMHMLCGRCQTERDGRDRRRCRSYMDMGWVRKEDGKENNNVC